jgi:predicted enzyme related to lactoylglutathione lyase
MLTRSEVHANVPASDLKRARTFYTETLGLEPSAENDYSITFPTPSGSWFQVYQTSYAGTGKHTIAQWDVDDLNRVVTQLKERGVAFEHYDIPGVDWDGDIATVPGMRSAWFLDSEGNVMCLDERSAT